MKKETKEDKLLVLEVLTKGSKKEIKIEIDYEQAQSLYQDLRELLLYWTNKLTKQYNEV